MRVLLAHPPLTPAGAVTPPLGLCTLASWLRARGHDVQIVDLDLEVRSCRQPHAEYLDIFEKAMRAFEPHVAGVTSMYSNSLQAEELVRVAKRTDASVMTVAGGSHFGAVGARALRRIPELDYAIEGESEAAFAALLDGVAPEAIPRLHYWQTGELRHNASGELMDLVDLPPMWSTLGSSVALERYPPTIPASSPRRVVYVEAGRGCPFRCTFCATAPFWEHRFRVKPVSRLVEEIRYLHESFGYDSFTLIHDLLTVSRKFISEFCDEMLASRLPVEWMANSRTDSRLDGLLPKMKAAGCWKLFHGVESASERLQHVIDKRLSMDQVYSGIDSLNAHGIAATTSFVIGLPTESAVELSSTIGMGARLKLRGVETVQFHRLRHFPPSPLSRLPRESTFDLDSLRIEYPFLEVPVDSVNAIRADPEFFSGYWLTDADSGTPANLAQVEMFFHHAVALAPITIAAAAAIAGERLIATFYDALAIVGAIRREHLDWEAGNLWGNWLELSPLLDCWIDGVASADDWRHALLVGLKTYEADRNRFVTLGLAENAIASGRSWAAFLSPVNLPTACERLRDGQALDDTLLHEAIVALSRAPDGRCAAYIVSGSRREDLVGGNMKLTECFNLS